MGLPLQQALAALAEIAPLSLAETWDNVGLLVEPSAGAGVERVLLAIDLTEAVLAEAVRAGADLIVAYHPPIFAPLARLVQRDPNARVLLGAIAAGIAVYSPHTALDAAAGGVNDWLADGLGAGARRPLAPHADDAAVGQGREVVLDVLVPFDELVQRVKAHLGLAQVRTAAPAPARLVQRIALCAGAGGTVLAGSDADVYLTGEMRHHDVLAATAAGTSVILCEHSHTERGYLPVLAARLREHWGARVAVAVSQVDAEPLRPG